MTNPEKLRQARDKLGLSQSKMANAMHTSVKNIQRWEQGGNVPDMAVRLAELLADNPQLISPV